MVTPFGFSAGDIASCIQLLSTVIVALKDSAAAREEFQDAQIFLEHLCLVLSRLQHLDVDCLDPAFTNALSATSQTVIQTIQEFTTEIRPTAVAMERGADCRTLRSAFRSVEWRLRIKKKVQALVERVSTDMQMLELLMQSQVM
jgi:hypothetical protein